MIQQALIGFFLLTAAASAFVAVRIYLAFRSEMNGRAFDDMPSRDKDSISYMFASVLFFWGVAGVSLFLAYLLSK